VLGLKLGLTLPVLAVAFLVAHLIGYGSPTREAIYVLSVGLLFDQVGKTCEGVFNGTERGDLLSLTLIVQRLVNAALGLAALAAGYGVVAVAASYSIGSALGVIAGVVVLRRHIGIPRLHIDRRGWPRLAAAGFPFAVQDVVNVLLFKIDAVMLSLLSTQAAVGRYGSAYRLLESTMFVGWALYGAFSAMYAYLGRDSEPSVGSVYQRSIKVALVLLVPCAVAFGVLAEPICALVFGADFRAAAPSLRLLAPVVVMLCLVTLSGSLIASRMTPRPLVRLTASAVVLNVLLNLALIPSMDDRGAALAMLLTEIVFVAAALRLAVREVGGIAWGSAIAAPVAAGVVMAAAMLALLELPLLALAVGALLYVATFVLLEQRISPGDLSFVKGLLRRTLRFASR
jgi:O-antigen/teichoic acid export membrane protein